MSNPKRIGAVLAATILATLATSTAHATGGYVYTPLNPQRILDTRDGGGPVGPNGVYTLHVSGAGAPVPANATEIVFNLTATDSTDSSFVTVYPDGTARPATSNLDFPANASTANLVMAQIGTDGSIDIWNHSGTVDLIADLAGYYAPGSTGTFQPVASTRILDTRNGIGTPGGSAAGLGQNSTLGLQVSGIAGVPTTGVTAVVLDLVATNGTDASFLDAYPDGSPMPDASSVDFGPSQTVANLVVLPVTDGKVDIWNHTGSVDVVADIYGYYTSGSGETFTPTTPTRVLDTRTGTQIGPNGVAPVRVTGSTTGIPATAGAVVVHFATVNATQDSSLTLYPDSPVQPDTSNLNFTPLRVTSNLAIILVGEDGYIDIWNHFGSTDVVADVVGYYAQPTS
ncbi:MAG TPA: hypothetical protein VH333_24410 [Pseudonocardiaceae bacterium]|jgi:hypothetical protein|nr:hypothetical protein [Pseudonocardiaceae bacterium]